MLQIKKPRLFHGDYVKVWKGRRPFHKYERTAEHLGKRGRVVRILHGTRPAYMVDFEDGKASALIPEYRLRKVKEEEVTA